MTADDPRAFLLSAKLFSAVPVRVNWTGLVLLTVVPLLKIRSTVAFSMTLLSAGSSRNVSSGVLVRKV